MNPPAPVSLTRFVGREQELVEIERLLAERRLVTLTGVGGGGKSRLAAQVCARLVDDHPDGVWWLDLGSVGDPDVVPRMVAATLGVLVDPDGDPLQGLVNQMRESRLVLCLDTCEHLLDVTAPLTEALLLTCPDVRVLATSREPLGVAGEAVWRIPSLKASEAVDLFADRAALVSPEFSLEAHRADVESVCRQLDGIPLAIELAAAWVRALTTAQIVAGLDESFRLLAGGPRGALPRHQTLLGSMDWSHELLDESEVILFRRLAVFAGEFTLEAVASVCRDEGAGAEVVLDVVGRLVDKSLVVVRPHGSEVSYHMLDTVRQYAVEKLRTAGEVDTLRDRHLDYFLDLVERAEPELDRDQDTWRTRLETVHDDISAAFRTAFASTGGRDRGRRLGAAMARQWFIRGQAREGIEVLLEGIALDPADRSALQGRLLAGTAMLGMVGGRRAMSGDLAARGLTLAIENHDDRTRARCQLLVAYPLFFSDSAKCEELATQAFMLGDEAGDPFAQDWGRILAAYSLTTRDRHDEAVDLARVAFDQARPRGDRFCAGFARGVEVYASMYTGDVRGAVTIGQDVMTIVAPLGDYFAVGTNAATVAMARGLSGDIEGGHQTLATIARSIDEAPDVDVVGLTVSVGLLHLWDGRLDDAVRWFERGLRQPSADSDDWTAIRCLPGLTSALRRLGRHDEASLRAQEALTQTKNGPYLLADSLDELGFLAADDNPTEAMEHHQRALAVRRESGLRTFYANSLDALASAELRVESFPEAVRLLAASDVARQEIGNPRPPVDLPGHQAATTTLKAAMGGDFETAWADGAALTLDEAVTLASRGRGPRNRPAAGWASLTPTELEVVRLIIEGLSNPDIAGRLFISRATVKTHLSHIFTKLAVANRTELAIFASSRIK